MLAPAGAPESSEYVRLLAGISGSVALFVIVTALPSSTVRLAMGASTGALFTSFTTTVKLRVSLSGGEPLSVTRAVTVFVAGPCASVGVHVNTPLLALMLAPDGGETR